MSSNSAFCLRVRVIREVHVTTHMQFFHCRILSLILCRSGFGFQKTWISRFIEFLFWSSLLCPLELDRCHKNELPSFNNLICLSIVNTIYFSTSSLPNENNFIFNGAWQCKIGSRLTGPCIPCGNYVLRLFQFEIG